MLYSWLIALIFYRFTFFPFGPSDFTRPFWINMGAMAILAYWQHVIKKLGRKYTLAYWSDRNVYRL